MAYSPRMEWSALVTREDKKTEGGDVRRGLAGEEEERRDRNKGLEPWNKGMRGVKLWSKYKSSWFPGMVVAGGIQVRHDPKEGKGPSALHFLPLKIPPQECFL